jgi:adenylate cyclase
MIAQQSLHKALNAIFDKNIAPFTPSSVVSKAAYTRNFSTVTEASNCAKSEISTSGLIRNAVGKTNQYPTAVGSHPDFAHLEYGDEEYHHCTSVFVDLKGSTRLARTLPLPKVQQIKNGLLESAIEIFQAFDGHIQRLQGDAVFALFCRKGVSKEDSMVDALNAASVLQAFIEDYLNPKFEAVGLPEIAARIGIDFGDDDEVLWSRYGVGDCHEITTTSLHTDLASKLQSRAKSRGIMIGDNVRKLLDIPDEFLEVKKIIKDGIPVDRKYIVEYGDFKYRMWSFKWETYLRYFAISRSSGTPLLTSANTLAYTCETRLPGQEVFSQTYLSGCGTLPKSTLLKFNIQIPAQVRWDDIKWTVENRGAEASDDDGILTFNMDKYKNKTTCYQSTAFLGHHYMRCRVFNAGKLIADEKLGIFVRAA